MRALEITLILLSFSLLTTLIDISGALPNVNTAADSQWSGDDVENMVITQNVTSSDLTGTVGYFTQGMSLLTKIFKIVLGTCVVAVPICNLFGWTQFVVTAAAAIQTIVYVMIAYDLLYLWRGVSWRSG